MKDRTIRPIALAGIVVVSSLVASATGVVDERVANADGDGFKETNTDPWVDVPTPDHTSHVRLVRQDDQRRTPYYEQAGASVLADFAPYASRWVVSGGSALVPALKQVVVCVTTASTLGVALDPDGIETVCAAIDQDGGAFLEPIQAGAWVRGTCADGTVLYTSSPNPFEPNHLDADGKGCDSVHWDGSGWSVPEAAFCDCGDRQGAPCTDPCFVTPGTVDGKGMCVVPGGAKPFCPKGKSCNGNPNQKLRCD